LRYSQGFYIKQKQFLIMRTYIIQHSFDKEWIVKIEAINSEVVNYCHEFYIKCDDGSLLTARYPTRNWQIIEVVYGD